MEASYKPAFGEQIPHKKKKILAGSPKITGCPNFPHLQSAMSTPQTPIPFLLSSQPSLKKDGRKKKKDTSLSGTSEKSVLLEPPPSIQE